MKIIVALVRNYSSPPCITIYTYVQCALTTPWIDCTLILSNDIDTHTHIRFCIFICLFIIVCLYVCVCPVLSLLYSCLGKFLLTPLIPLHHPLHTSDNIFFRYCKLKYKYCHCHAPPQHYTYATFQNCSCVCNFLHLTKQPYALGFAMHVLVHGNAIEC